MSFTVWYRQVIINLPKKGKEFALQELHEILKKDYCSKEKNIHILLGQFNKSALLINEDNYIINNDVVFKNMFSSYNDYDLEIKLEDFLNDNIAEFETIASFEEFFVENQERFIGYIASCGCGYLKIVYENFMKKKAVKLNLKTQKQFFDESLTSDDYLFSFEDYLSFMEGINKVFDANIDSNGEYRRW